MNIVAVCELLGNAIQISSVRYGTHVVQRINTELPVGLHLDETLTGHEIMEKFSQLPDEAKHALIVTPILTPTEASVFVDDVARFRQVLVRQSDASDNTINSFITTLMIVMFIVASAQIMRYVFTALANDDPVRGAMVSVLKYFFDTFLK